MAPTLRGGVRSDGGMPELEAPDTYCHHGKEDVIGGCLRIQDVEPLRPHFNFDALSHWPCGPAEVQTVPRASVYWCVEEGHLSCLISGFQEELNEVTCTEP